MNESRWEKFSNAELDVIYHAIAQNLMWSNIKTELMSEIQSELLKRRQILFNGISNCNFK